MRELVEPPLARTVSVYFFFFAKHYEKKYRINRTRRSKEERSTQGDGGMGEL